MAKKCIEVGHMIEMTEKLEKDAVDMGMILVFLEDGIDVKDIAEMVACRKADVIQYILRINRILNKFVEDACEDEYDEDY